MKNLYSTLVMALCLTAVTLSVQAQGYVRLTDELFRDETVFTDVDSVVLKAEPLTKKASEMTISDLVSLAEQLYPENSPAMIAELSGDNFVDNNVLVPNTNLTPMYGFLDQLFNWQPVDADDPNANRPDAPRKVWTDYQARIAIAGVMVEATQLLEAQHPTLAADLQMLRGEAMLERAHLRLTLRYIFKTNITDADIESDITAGLPLLGNANEGNARRMNPRAAHALAARYYLLKHNWQQVLIHTNAALGDNPAEQFRPWADYQQTAVISEKLSDYYDPAAKCNYLVEHTYSMRDRIIFNMRYATNGDAVYGTFMAKGPNWTSYTLPAFTSNLYVAGGQEYGVWLFRAYEFFEYTDEELGIGYVCNDYTPYTAEETLLMRAEARFYLGDTEGCLADLNLWTQSKLVTQELTLDRINSFFSSTGSLANLADMESTGWSQQDITTAYSQNALASCILYFRRIETIYDGLRWMDIQRYGLTITHKSRMPYGQVQTSTISAAKGYLRDAPSGTDDFDNIVADIYMKNDSIYSLGSPRNMQFSNDLTADETAQKAVETQLSSGSEGWLFQEFSLRGAGMQDSVVLAETRVLVGGEVMALCPATRYQDGYRIVSRQEGEIILEPIDQEKNYPVVVRLTPLTAPWSQYSAQCDSVKALLAALPYVFANNQGYLVMGSENYFSLSASFDGIDVFAHLPFVPTPTGVRFANEAALNCDPEFIFDAAAQTLTSRDGKVVFRADWLKYISSKLISSTCDYTVENPTAEWQQTFNDIEVSLPTVNSNWSLSNFAVGRMGTTGSAGITSGFGLKFFTNVDKTRSNLCGATATITLSKDGGVIVNVPGLDTGEVTFDKNAETISKQSEAFKNAFLSMLTQVQAINHYTFDAETRVLRLSCPSGMTLVVQM